MARFVILLRAVNVGGTGKLPMAEFRRLLADVKCTNVQTYIQSGNAVVDARCSAAALRKAISTALKKHMGAPVPVMIRTRAELERVVKENPFAAEADADGARVHAVFLSEVHPAAKAKELQQIVDKYPTRRDRFHLAGDTLYLHLPDGAAETKFTAQSVDRILSGTGTARNWNTVLKLLEMSGRE